MFHRNGLEKLFSDKEGKGGLTKELPTCEDFCITGCLSIDIE